MILRPYQESMYQRVKAAWNTLQNVLAVLPTGGGKTVLFCRILSEHQGYSMAVAHRQELVSQMSLTLAKAGIVHNIIAPREVIKWIIATHTQLYGRPYFKQNAFCTVAGVDTIISRKSAIKNFLGKVTLWVIDEGHHVLKNNKWGKAVNFFPPNAKGLSVTATPARADGKGLGRDNDGVNDTIIIGPSGRDLIDEGYLCDYKIFAPPNSLDLSPVDISKTTGDYSKNKLVDHMRKYPVVGDIVQHYLRLTPGKLGITFVTDVTTAEETAAAFRQQGVPAECIHAKTKPQIRQNLISRFQRGELKQLVNVDIFGEGFDLPALEVVSMGRPSNSFPLVSQQFGRMLRPMDGKTHGVLIDHVGNIMRHAKTTGLPDADIPWSLERRGGGGSGDRAGVVPARTCMNCTAVYKATNKICPHCGHAYVPEDRSKPEYVDGDLTELCPEELAKLRAEVARIDRDPQEIKVMMERAGSAPIVAMGAAKQHRLRREAQTELRSAIALWAGYEKANFVPESESYIKFYYKFGIDVLSAQALGRKEAEKLRERINEHNTAMGEKVGYSRRLA